MIRLCFFSEIEGRRVTTYARDASAACHATRWYVSGTHSTRRHALRNTARHATPRPYILRTTDMATTVKATVACCAPRQQRGQRRHYSVGQPDEEYLSSTYFHVSKQAGAFRVTAI
ncbi:hypothetical protein NPIL_25621 [Nephila pilipes]|uniref:Uncharacterized protein n=1 Tax=Nephila pilipes TaxID=299642 RepID=A0A8X6MB54_NEPPI|nr:hypothetical protein NPIL_25621 [Nephila pilipes]